MKSFKTYIFEKLKVSNNQADDITEVELDYIASLLADFIEDLAYQNDEDIENTIDELTNNNVYDCLSYWDNGIESFIEYFDDNSNKKYDEKKLEAILNDYAKELTEIVLRKLPR